MSSCLLINPIHKTCLVLHPFFKSYVVYVVYVFAGGDVSGLLGGSGKVEDDRRVVGDNEFNA